MQLTVRVDPPCAATADESAARTALAAAIYVRRRDGSLRALLSDGSWGWRDGHVDRLTPSPLWDRDIDSELAPRGAAWLTHLPRSSVADSFHTSLVKILPADVCAGAAPAPAVGAVGGADQGGPWGAPQIAATAALGALTALMAAVTVALQVALRRTRRRHAKAAAAVAAPAAASAAATRPHSARNAAGECCK